MYSAEIYYLGHDFMFWNYLQVKRIYLKRARYACSRYASCYLLYICVAISVPDYANSNVETTFLGQFYICLHFSRKQQQIFIIFCSQYHIRNQRTRLLQ